MASTLQSGGAYTLDEAYEASLMASASNSRLRIARELLPRAVGVDPARSRWSRRAPAGAHAAVAEQTLMAAAAAPHGGPGGAGSCHSCATAMQSPMAAAAAPSGGPGGSGACHNCGEQGHYKNGCPHPRQNSSGRGQGGGGGRGGGRAPRACFVCGDLTHLAGSCPKRVMPAVAAAALDAAPETMRRVGSADYRAFEDWRAMTAAAAMEAEGSGEDGKWDDQDYALGAVALPAGCGMAGPAVHLAAAGTKAGAEKAKATRAAARGRAPVGGGGLATAAAKQARGVGTALIAKAEDLAATDALRGRRDKAAAKKRMAKLPDHGRHVVPQGLNRLPAGFPVRAVAGQAPVVLPARTTAPAPAPVPSLAPGTQGRASSGVQHHVPDQGGATQVGFVSGPVLTGSVQLQVGAFLEMALRAGMDLAAVAPLTGNGGPAVPAPRQESATLAALQRIAPRALAQQAGAMLGLSPVARRAHAAMGPTVVPMATAGPDGGTQNAGIGAPLHVVQKNLEEEVPIKKGAGSPLTGALEAGGLQTRAGGVPKRGVPTYRETATGAARFDPESSAMGVQETDRVARNGAAARQAARMGEEALEEQVISTSRDAELAMLLVAEEARERGVDRDVVLRAQGGFPGERTRAEAQSSGADKGKGVAQETGTEEEERAFGWEHRLSTGAWRGASDLAPITLQPGLEGVGSRAHTHALACFADGRPLVSTTDRGGFEGTPDWVNNSGKAVQVMSPSGLVAPGRVLIDGGSFYSMAGLSLRAQLGLTAADMDAGGHKVHTATGKVELLPGGLTRNPIPIVLNKGEPSEVTLYEKLAFTDSRGYDLLIGTRAAYPCGLSVDRWAERAIYRADWRSKGEVVGHLPMRLHQERQNGWTVVGGKGRRLQCQAGAALACCLTQ
jgi:GNAT superfamily N-acetyltransferase